MNFRTLRKDEIDIRVGQVFKSEYREGATLLLYKNARVDMDILDETVGSENWQRSQQEIKGNLYCNVSIYNAGTSQWVTKQDCGVESNTEAEKGEASDAFKRACVNWGIGRELYRAPKIFIKWDVEEKNGKKQLKYNPSFYVKSIDYSNTREITQLTIEASSGGTKRIVFDWKAGNEPQQPQSTPQLTNDRPQQNKPYSQNNGVKSENPNWVNMTLDEAMNYKVTFGKQANIPFKEVPEYYLKWLLENAKVPQTRKAAELVLADLEKTKKAVTGGSQLEIIPLSQEEQDDLPF